LARDSGVPPAKYLAAPVRHGGGDPILFGSLVWASRLLKLRRIQGWKMLSKKFALKIPLRVDLSTRLMSQEHNKC
jgi:hypothetical protein